MEKYEVGLGEEVHESIIKIMDQGFEIYFELDDPASDDILQSRYLRVEVRKNTMEAAKAVFFSSTQEVHCDEVFVNATQRCNGIANAMYIFAELKLDQVLENFWENYSKQSKEAKLLWAQENRPFGNMK